MAKKKSKRAAAASSTSAADGGEKDIAELFALLQQKGAAWYDREREGIALIEGFQSALVACRDAAPAVEDVSPPADYAASDQSQLRSLSGLGGNVDMDPWLAEDLYQQVQQLPRTFEELLGEMYALQSQARELMRTLAASEDDQPSEAAVLRPVDYFQMINQELAAFEAEYQHVEALLHLISFEVSTDELRTLAISWSTSPFLEPAQSRAFLQRHQLSQRLQEAA